MSVKTSDTIYEITRHMEILPGVYRTFFRYPRGAPQPLPGQFVQIEPSPGLFPLTRRPFTVNRADGEGFEVIFDVVGRGTAVLSGLEKGSAVRILGPLGRGWNTAEPGEWLLIGGGLGAAGFQYLLETVQCSRIVMGASSASRLLPLECSCEVLVATEDGSRGSKGLVTDVLSPEIFSAARHIAICGPVAMMHAVWEKIPDEHRNRVQVSTESRMGCGWGVCEGCSIPVVENGYRKCCTDGPVFPGNLIDWERWKEAGL